MIINELQVRNITTPRECQLAKALHNLIEYAERIDASLDTSWYKNALSDSIPEPWVQRFPPCGDEETEMERARR